MIVTDLDAEVIEARAAIRKAEREVDRQFDRLRLVLASPQAPVDAAPRIRRSLNQARADLVQAEGHLDRLELAAR